MMEGEVKIKGMFHMFVVSTFELQDPNLAEDLKKSFPEVTFEFFKKVSEIPKEKLKHAEIILTYGNLTTDHINIAENLKWIMVASAGVERMPLNMIEEKKILVTNARGIHKIPMAEYTIAMMLQVARNSKKLIENERNCLWDRTIETMELNGKTIAILGVGAIGGEIARLAKAFRMKTLGITRTSKQVEFVDEIYSLAELDEVLPQADFVVSVLPSTKETKHVLKHKQFQLMKDNSVFINIGRGDVVAEEILLKALELKEISHAVLDVFETEPIDEDHPFWKMENVTVTPHLSSVTKGYQPRALQIFKHNLNVYLKNENADFINMIDLERGY
ncbi:D-2-hydroxyacid dehydrogenase [Sutcliffiella sp. NC1]|uniref:D-2-hydroxyacid dehydrogenase n=1 Tax=Sutcliffiella sp. NC1 TaxID=3004096 RepID=UPI0022DE4C8A|nr:D-2-hydroxyacid dehydrogenase [Sutcliffiella sp. NC1]WBL15940.1 D-2-hydroxyacid dehydrogenase [Sutcliffiella sp. NC1]